MPTASDSSSRDSTGEGYSNIFSVALDGSSLKRLTKAGKEVTEHSPQESANGRFVVFKRDGRILTMRPNSSGQKRLAVGHDPAISPDGHSVAYSCEDQIDIVGSGGGGSHALTHLKASTAGGLRRRQRSLPTGGWIVFALEETNDCGPGFTESQKLMKVSVATGKVVDLTTTKGGGFHPDWQPLP